MPPPLCLLDLPLHLIRHYTEEHGPPSCTRPKGSCTTDRPLSRGNLLTCIDSWMADSHSTMSVSLSQMYATVPPAAVLSWMELGRPMMPLAGFTS